MGQGRYPGCRDQRHTNSDSNAYGESFRNSDGNSHGNTWIDSAKRSGAQDRGNKYNASQMEGATSANMDVYRNGVVVVTTPNDGQYDDSTGTTGQASFMYKVCEAAIQNCSNTVTVNFGP